MSAVPQLASRALREIEALGVEPTPMFAHVKGRVLIEHADGRRPGARVERMVERIDIMMLAS